jgi:DNA repair exonuclease SbcCD nuclease subunit
LHTADWQIGKQFANIEGDASALLRTRRIETVSKIAEHASRLKVDAVLVAGDVFETNQVSGKTILQTFEAMGNGFDGQWFLLPGNHDSAEPSSVWERIRKNFVNKNIFVLDQPEPYFLPQFRTVILPAPLQRRHDSRDLTNWFDDFACDEDVIRIGFAHGSLDNRLQHRGEAANTISDTRATSAHLDYLALGDWHGTLNIADRTWYSGTPEPDRFKANDSGNVLHVEVTERGAQPKVEKISVGHYIWCQMEQQLFGENDADGLEQHIRKSYALDRTLLKLSLSGAVSLDSRNYLDKIVERLTASAFYLEVDDSALSAEPSTDDLDGIDQSGFVGATVSKLLQLANNPVQEEADTARLALQILYSKYKTIEDNRCK